MPRSGIHVVRRIDYAILDLIIADTGYDSDQLRERLKRRAIELIAPYRKNNKRQR
jgi:hypothetical protein